MEKKVYHEPELRTYGSLTEVTLDPSDDPLFLIGEESCWYL